MQPLKIEVYWSFRSPWSYLATPRLARWKREYQLEIDFRPVYPIAIRTPEFFDAVQPQWLSYFMVDLPRVAEFLGLPCVWPQPDPVVNTRDAQGRQSFAAEQPYIHRLTRLGVLANEAGRGIEFADCVSRMLWRGTRDWHLGEHLQAAVAEAELNLADLDQAVLAEAERLELCIEQNQTDHAAAGHWGVPTCVFNGEPFFGQDRLDVLMWRLQAAGLKPAG
jgi:2-hydroxychromene-2-carboxylate isomerase